MGEMMTIKEVAKRYNITTNKLRFYEKKGLLKPYRDPESGYRKYSVEDLLTLQIILTYRALEVPVKLIEDLLSSDQRKTLMDQLYTQWAMVNEQLHKYRKMQEALEVVLDEQLTGTAQALTESVLKAGNLIGDYSLTQNNWEDRWAFDDWAVTYDQSVRDNKGSLNLYGVYETVLQTVYDLSCQGLASDGRVIDIGVGTGNLSEKFLHEGLEVIGVDQSRQMLYVAKKKHPDLKLRLGEFLKLPFENNVADRIVSTYAFHHLTDKEKARALREMLRVLKENGEIIIGDMMFENAKTREEYLSKVSEEDKVAIMDEYYTDIEVFGQELKGLGYSYQVKRLDALIFVMRIFKET